MTIVGAPGKANAFAGMITTPSPAKIAQARTNSQTSIKKASLTAHEGVAPAERMPLSLHLGNRQHLFDGYFLCEKDKLSPAIANLVGFSD